MFNTREEENFLRTDCKAREDCTNQVKLQADITKEVCKKQCCIEKKNRKKFLKNSNSLISHFQYKDLIITYPWYNQRMITEEN